MAVGARSVCGPQDLVERNKGRNDGISGLACCWGQASARKRKKATW